MVAYLIRVSTAFFGEQTPFSVRFPFLVLSGFTTYLIYRASCILFQNRSRAVLAATVFNLTPIALLGGSAAIHDNALLFFWVMALWAAASFVRSEDPRWFYTMGAAAGLAIQSKYTGGTDSPVCFGFSSVECASSPLSAEKRAVDWSTDRCRVRSADIVVERQSPMGVSASHFLYRRGSCLARQTDTGWARLSLSPIPFGVPSVLLCTGGWNDFSFDQEPLQAQSSTSSVAMFGTSSAPFWTSGIQRARGSQLGLDGLPINLYPVCGDYPNSSRGVAKGPVEMVWRTIP